MDPLSYLVTPLVADLARSGGYAINERAAHMTEFDDVEDTSIDLYAAVRNGCLQQRQKSIDAALSDRDRSWTFTSKRFVETRTPLDSCQQMRDDEPLGIRTE